MSGFNPFFTHQYGTRESSRSIKSLAPSSLPEVTPETHSPDRDHGMIGGHPLDGVITQNQDEIQGQQRPLPPTYHLIDQDSRTGASALMMFEPTGPNDMSPYPFDSSQTQNVVTGSASTSMLSSVEEMQMQHLQSPRGVLNIEIGLPKLVPDYGATPFRSSIGRVGPFNYDMMAPYAPQTVGPIAGFDQGEPTQLMPVESQSVNLLPFSAYATLSQGSIPGTFPHHNPQNPAFSSGRIRVIEEENWLGSTSNLMSSTPGQGIQNLFQPTDRQMHSTPSTSSLATQLPSQHPPQQLSHVVNTTPVLSTSGPTYIPSEAAVSSEPSPGAGRNLDVYSNSGFDMFEILAHVARRPNPEINIGAVDMSCAFIVCDITAYDDPIIYASGPFERLTGYTKHEILGRNCRFLQAPDGKVDARVKRKYVDDRTVYHLKSKLQARSEVQVGLINYRKGGQPFMNLLTMIPVRGDSEEYKFFIGLQVDLVEQPHAVTKRNADGSYTINYKQDQLPRYSFSASEPRRAQVSCQKVISHEGVSVVLNAVTFQALDSARQYLDRVLLENTDDILHVMSLKGRFIYLSPSSRKLLGYDASELIGKALSSVCHPSDIAPVIRELEQSVAGSPVSLVYRIRRKHSGYMWFESHGSLHIEPEKGRRCLILSGRERPVYALSRAAILETGGIGDSDIWSKMSISGMFLFISSNVRALLDRQADEFVGKNIQEFMRDESRLEFEKALDVARTGQQASFRHELRHKRNHVLQARTTIYPGDSQPGSKPSFLIAQTRFIKSSRSNFLQRKPVITSPSDGHSRSVGLAPATMSSDSTNMQMIMKQTSTPLMPEPLHMSTEREIYGLPLGNQDELVLSEDNIFEELNPTRSTSWQFELRQLERNNRLLAEELQGLLSRKKKRKRKKGTGPVEKACVNCHTRSTPEWRRGPSGSRDLCNSCGLRWAKQTGRISPRKNSDHGDKNLNTSMGKPSLVVVDVRSPERPRNSASTPRTVTHAEDHANYSSLPRELPGA